MRHARRHLSSLAPGSLRRSLLLQSEVLVRSWPRPDGVSHLVACSRTGACALIDPVEQDELAYRRVIQDLELRPRFELHTCPPTTSDTPVEVSRYTDLLASLGTRLDRDLDLLQDDELHWDGVLIVRPRQGDEQDLLVELGLAEVRLRADSDEAFTWSWTRQGEDTTAFGRLRLPLGAFHVQVIALPDGRAAYQVGDRVFTARPALELPPRLAGLEPQTLVYFSGAREGGGWVTTVQEQLYLAGEGPWLG